MLVPQPQHGRPPHIPHIPRQATNAMNFLNGKHAYATWLGVIDKSHPKGKFVIQRLGTSFPYTKEDVWKITNYQEIHYMCPGNAEGRPRPIEIKDREGYVKWIHPDDIIIVQIPSFEF